MPPVHSSLPSAWRELPPDRSARVREAVQLDVILAVIGGDQRNHSGGKTRCLAADSVALITGVDLPDHRTIRASRSTMNVGRDHSLQTRGFDAVGDRGSSERQKREAPMFRVLRIGGWSGSDQACAERRPGGMGGAARGTHENSERDEPEPHLAQHGVSLALSSSLC